MSHAVETMAYAGEVPWHGLGVPVSNDLTPKEMLVAAGLDWTVTARQLYYDYTVDGKTKRGKVGNKVLTRDSDGKVLSTITKGWNPVQNEEAFEFFADLVETGRMEMHTAGSLMGGRKVWALAKINEAFDLRVNGRVTQDNVEGFLLLTNPHEYGKSIDARLTAIRVVCNNTHCLAMADDGATSVALNHRRKFDPIRLQEMLGLAHLSMTHYKETAEFLASKRYTDEAVAQFFGSMFPRGKGESQKLSKAAAGAMDALEKQPGHDFAPGSWWNAYNAVSYITDHVMGKSDDARLTQNWYGYNRARKIRALSAATEYANAA